LPVSRLHRRQTLTLALQSASELDFRRRIRITAMGIRILIMGMPIHIGTGLVFTGITAIEYFSRGRSAEHVSATGGNLTELEFRSRRV
jgi:hypothetical protein